MSGTTIFQCACTQTPDEDTLRVERLYRSLMICGEDASLCASTSVVLGRDEVTRLRDALTTWLQETGQ